MREIEQRQTSVSEVSKLYQVRANNVYKWIDKYSKKQEKGLRLVLEMESDTKKLLALQAKIAELERLVGQKQVIIEFQDKMIEIAEQEYQIDIKKKFESKPLSSSGSIETK